MDHPTTALQEYLTDLVEPHQRPCMNIIPDHITMLQGVKSKKQISRKKRAHKSAILTRRDYGELGLHTLPTRQMLYVDALPLHELWKGYMKEHIDLEPGEPVPKVHEPKYDGFSKSLVKTDLHGAEMRVIQSKCPTLVGLAGICVLESKNVLKLLGKDDRIRTVPKSECVFGMSYGSIEFTIFGQHLRMRPSDRSVKKIKNYIEPFM